MISSSLFALFVAMSSAQTEDSNVCNAIRHAHTLSEVADESEALLQHAIANFLADSREAIVSCFGSDGIERTMAEISHRRDATRNSAWTEFVAVMRGRAFPVISGNPREIRIGGSVVDGQTVPPGVTAEVMGLLVEYGGLESAQGERAADLIQSYFEFQIQRELLLGALADSSSGGRGISQVGGSAVWSDFSSWIDRQHPDFAALLDAEGMQRAQLRLEQIGPGIDRIQSPLLLEELTESDLQRIQSRIEQQIRLGPQQ